MIIIGEEVRRGPPLKRNLPERKLDMLRALFVHHPSQDPGVFFFSSQFLALSNLRPFLRLATTLLGCTLHTLDYPICNSEAQLTRLLIKCNQDLTCIGFQIGESLSLKKGKNPKL